MTLVISLVALTSWLDKCLLLKSEYFIMKFCVTLNITTLFVKC